MGILNKLMFWRKREAEDEGVEGEEGVPGDLGAERVPEQGSEVPPWSQAERYEERPRLRPMEFEREQAVQQPQIGNVNEVIMAKLDVINAKLDALNQRLINLERYAAEEEKRASRW